MNGRIYRCSHCGCDEPILGIDGKLYCDNCGMSLEKIRRRADDEREKILSVDLCKDTLEISIGEVDTYIPKQVIESTLYYLKEYERLKSLQSWSDFPESMGR